jgi:hypothetical protein
LFRIANKAFFFLDESKNFIKLKPTTHARKTGPSSPQQENSIQTVQTEQQLKTATPKPATTNQQHMIGKKKKKNWPKNPQ